MSPIQNTPTGEEAVTVAFSPTLGVLIAKHLTIWLLTLWTSVTATLYPKARGFTMQQAETNWQERFEDLAKMTRGCEVYENALVDYDSIGSRRGTHVSVYDPNKRDNWGNRKWSYGGNSWFFAWKMLNGLEVKLPLYILNDSLDKYRFFVQACNNHERMKETGDKIHDMYGKHGCPKCGNKDLTLLESDGESEGDGCSADWVIWNHWSYWCENKDCGWAVSGSYVKQSGGNYDRSVYD